MDMIELKVHPSGLNPIIEWCKDYIGPQKYYIHNKIGGEAWTAKMEERVWKLQINDSKIALIAMLKFGDKLTK
jgi:hypothetical protein